MRSRPIGPSDRSQICAARTFCSGDGTTCDLPAETSSGNCALPVPGTLLGGIPARLHSLVRARLRALSSGGRENGRALPRVRHPPPRLCPHPLWQLPRRVSARLFLQDPLLLSLLPGQASGGFRGMGERADPGSGRSPATGVDHSPGRCVPPSGGIGGCWESWRVAPGRHSRTIPGPSRSTGPLPAGPSSPSRRTETNSISIPTCTRWSATAFGIGRNSFIPSTRWTRRGSRGCSNTTSWRC